MSSTKNGLFALLLIFPAACASTSPPEPQEPTPPALEDRVAPAPAREAPVTESNVAIAPDIRAACGISDAQALFAYDSARVRPADRQVLQKLADCFTTGPLKGREMRLVGHADPRGDDEYNRVLGQSRADSIQSAISSLGLPGEKIATTSRGEDEAKGRDEATWARDRRVDVLLGN